MWTLGGAFRTGALAVALPLTAVAQPQEGAGAAGYCDFVEGTAAAESALLVSPQLFANFGLTNAGEATGAGVAPIGSPAARLTAGVGWNVDRLLRGLTLQRRAAAECRRQHAIAGLQTALILGTDLGEADAAEARARVLREHLPRLEARLSTLRAEVKAEEATVEELRAFELRLDLVRGQLRLAEGDRQRLSGKPAAPTTPLPSLVAAASEADGQVEQLSAQLRTQAAFELGVRGGYDRLFGSDAVPVFGLVTVSVNPGRLFQGDGNERSQEGRARWMREDAFGVTERSAQLLRELRAVHDAAELRRSEVGALEADLRTQLEAVRKVEAKAVRPFRDLLEFEHARVASERAYLEQKAKGISAFLGAAQ